MCGIAGQLTLDGSAKRVERDALERMQRAMVHRGPDGHGTWLADDGRCGLAHRRLAIIDLSDTAAQPMTNEDGRVVVSFNGEIYNHAEIRRELGHDRHEWRTDHSDTETIVHGFEEWGINCVHRFRGMFAIAIWDGRSNELWLVRDRIGIKPIYYTLHDGRFAFASEIKALLTDPSIPRQLDEESLFHYLSFLTTPAPRTLFQGIQKLPPGTWMRIRPNGEVTTERYWDAWDNVEPLTNASDEELSERTRLVLNEAVAERAIGDVPVGVFLSGGIDSSTNAALFAQHGADPVCTYSVGYDGRYDTYTNELDFARTMAGTIGADHHEVRLSVDDLFEFLPRMIDLQDEPIGDPVCFPVHAVSKLARDDGTIVCQVGEGADELFWGYPGWKRQLGLQMHPVFGNKLAARAGTMIGRLAGKGEGLAVEYLRRVAAGRPLFWGGAEAFTHAQKQRLLGPKLRSRLAGLDSWEAIAPIHARFHERAWEKTPLQWMTYLDLNLRLPELLLMRVDKMSMGTSIEARVPFLDHRLVELALSMPQSAKTRGGVLKTVLKRAVRGLIPDSIIDRPKQGFGVPVHEWFLGRFGDAARQTLLDFADETGYFDRDEIVRMFAEQRGPQSWYALNVALWWRHFVAGEQSPLANAA